MENNKSGGKAEKFFEGKGFYIVLALCIVVIGASVWSIAGVGKKAPVTLDPGITLANTPAPVIRSAEPEVAPVIKSEVTEPVVDAEQPVEDSETVRPQVWSLESEWVWPAAGELERGYAMDRLTYDVTMADWRTHDGIDIAADRGSLVCASGDGTVESVVSDELYGTTVTINHGSGIRTVYSNLAETPTVVSGDTVSAGDTIGSVGDTALCEVGEASHLHLAMSVDSVSVDPLEYLPE